VITKQGTNKLQLEMIVTKWLEKLLHPTIWRYHRCDPDPPKLQISGVIRVGPRHTPTVTNLAGVRYATLYRDTI